MYEFWIVACKDDLKKAVCDRMYHDFEEAQAYADDLNAHYKMTGWKPRKVIASFDTNTPEKPSGDAQGTGGV